MYTVFVVCIVIVIVVLLLAVITTSKAYSYKHTIDSLENNPNIKQENDQHTIEKNER
ncbi:YtzI protein [Bacillus sp. BRMEA1]|uniref:YtzI protein n=1 Tax=Neobacillus endophyticus TaxID=2738405 RepID=UPI0015636460|nr:YtzI protein [Neobacillus endophyticus]NRD76235.1 YtzI protein [Neobacillus endophyticus]